MWVKCKVSKDKYFYYLSSNEYIIEIRFEKGYCHPSIQDASGKPIKSDPFYSGVVLSITGDDIFILYDKDLDVLKLKCLLKAKDFGWDIKEI